MNGGETRSGFRLTPQILVGLVLVVIGVLFTLDTLDIAETSRYVRVWPAALILFGVVKVGQTRTAPGYVAGAFWILVGSWLLADNLGFRTPEFWEVWPALLVVAGIVLIVQALRGPASRAPADAEPAIHLVAIMSGVVRRSASKVFRRAEATAIMGGCKIDLRDAEPPPEGATIDTFAFWGGIEILVPPGWQIDNRVLALMAGVEDRTQGGAPPGAPRLTIRGVAVMAGIEIKHEPGR